MMHRPMNVKFRKVLINPLNAELNPICYLLALLGAHHFLHFGRIRVNGHNLLKKQHNSDKFITIY